MNIQKEIKFRVWSNKDKDFLHNITETWDLIYADGKWYFLGGKELDNNYVIQQFTGLYDKNKKPIYGGDVIKGMFDMGPAGEILHTATVHWDDLNGYQWNYWSLDTVEVIGNIFENPELLKQ